MIVRDDGRAVRAQIVGLVQKIVVERRRLGVLLVERGCSKAVQLVGLRRGRSCQCRIGVSLHRGLGKIDGIERANRVRRGGGRVSVGRDRERRLVVVMMVVVVVAVMRL